MNKQILSLFLVLLLPTTATATETTASYMMTQVYERLKIAIGDRERAWPALEIRPGASSVLAYNKRKNIIYVDEQALQICESFGAQQADAFAFLLAHEMTHFYQNHDWQEAGFASSFLTNKHSYNAHIIDEKEADLFGAFVTHLAGYRSIKLIPTIFDKIYVAYNLQQELQDYPPLAQRKATANEVCEKVKELIQIFETANYLNAIGAYTDAATAYGYVLQFVKYKELYNNAGASLVAAAALQPNYGQLPFRYPIELDLEIPLREGTDADKANLLSQAILYLSSAAKMDPSHYATFINLACAYSLANQLAETAALLTRLEGMVQTSKQQAEVVLLKGILKTQQQAKEEAFRLFQQASDLSREEGIVQLAKFNSQLLTSAFSVPNAIRRTNLSTENIGGIDLTYENDFPFKVFTLKDQFSYEEKQLQLYNSPSALLVHLVTSTKKIALLTTAKRGAVTQKGIGVGRSLAQIKQVYATYDSKILNHSRGYYLVYPQLKLIFNLNDRNEVMAWGIFEYY